MVCISRSGHIAPKTIAKLLLWALVLLPYVVIASPENHSIIPIPDFAVPQSEPPSKYIKLNLSKMSAENLRANAEEAYEADDYELAVQYQYWAIQKGDDNFYDLACDYALAGKITDAMHWLMVEAKEGAINLEWIKKDKDMKAVRADPSWPKLEKYLQSVSQFWQQSGKAATTVIVPKNYKANTPIDTLVGLHGRADTPTNFIDSGYQELADQLNIAIIGLSGTRPIGKNAYAWHQDTKRNLTHANALLAKALSEKKVKMDRAALFGFSQGAQVALQWATSEPQKWTGAFAMSPSLYTQTTLPIAKTADLSTQRYFISSGANESKYNLDLVKHDIAAIEARKGQVKHEMYAEQGHEVPDDYYQVFPEWLQEIFKR